MIPRVAHFVFGLRDQHEPFHFLHYLSVESCRRVLEPETIYFHHMHLPWGPWWDRIRAHLTLVEVDHVAEVLAADYSAGHVPQAFLYAHHADFIRLDALIEHGGVYADIDTIFVRPFPDELFEPPFVIGREPEVRDQITNESRPSLCNALLMAEPNALFARQWRARMAAELNGTWSNHSGFLSEELSRLAPSAVRVEPETSFFSFPPTRAGISRLFEERHAVPLGALSVHLWAHLWWDPARRDFSDAHASWCTPPFLGRAQTTFSDLARPYLPASGTAAASPREPTARPTTSSVRPVSGWSYVSLDGYSGYGVAAARCLAALEDSGLEVSWMPFSWATGLSRSEDALFLEALGRGDATGNPSDGGRPVDVVVAHLVPEHFPLVRRRFPDAFLVGHTVWDTDRIPNHWPPCLNEADLLVVPSRFAADALAAAEAVPPVEVVPHVAPPIWTGRSAAWTGIPPETFVFYTIGEWNERKAVFKTIEAYLRAFSGGDPVLLIVKTSHRDHRAAPPRPGAAGPGTTAWSVAHLLARHPDPPRVQLVTGALTDGEVADLHRRGDCFVSLCRSEGWGLGAFDAAAHGNPVVITGYGGHLDYLAGSPYLVGFDLVPVHDPAGFPSYAPDQRWAEPDVDHGSLLLREVAADPAEAAAFADPVAADIGWRYRPAAIATAFRAAVTRHRAPGLAKV